MSGITRYILRQLAIGTLLVTIALCCVLWLTQSLRFLELIINRGSSVGTFVHLTLLLLPNFLTYVLPIALFGVVLFTYNRLIGDRELMVLRAAGVSDWALARPALLLATALLGFGYVLNTWLIPLSVRDFRELQWAVRNDVTALLVQEGSFNQFGDDLTVFVRERSGSELRGIMVHDRRNLERPVTIMAATGALVRSSQGPRIVMADGSRQEVTKDNPRLSVLYFDSYSVDLAGGGSPTGARYRDPREWSMTELVVLREEGQFAPEFRRARVELHQRLITPVYHLAFTLLAVAAMLSGSYNRRGQLGRILATVALMVGLEAAALGAANLAVRNLAFLPLIYAVAAIPLLGALYVMLRPLLRQPRRFAAAHPA